MSAPREIWPAPEGQDGACGEAVSMDGLDLRIVFRCTCEGWHTDRTEFEDLNDARPRW